MRGNAIRLDLEPLLQNRYSLVITARPLKDGAQLAADNRRVLVEFQGAGAFAHGFIKPAHMRRQQVLQSCILSLVTSTMKGS